MNNLTQAEVCQELEYCGLGEMTADTALIREFEAYGDGQLNVVLVWENGVTVFFGHDDEELFRGHISTEDEVHERVQEFGHYAAC